MVAVTDRAKEQLLDMKLSANIQEPRLALRLQPDATGGWQLFPDQPVEGDQVVEYEGSNVLLIGVEASDALADRRIDCRETEPGQPQLVLVRTDTA